jgi:hypothetical protein
MSIFTEYLRTSGFVEDLCGIKYEPEKSGSVFINGIEFSTEITQDRLTFGRWIELVAHVNIEHRLLFWVWSEQRRIGIHNIDDFNKVLKTHGRAGGITSRKIKV